MWQGIARIVDSDYQFMIRNVFFGSKTGVPLCRYISRPGIAEQRLSLANNGNVIVALKNPYDDGTSHVVLSPLEFVGRLAAR